MSIDKSFESILQMRDIESFPVREILDMMNILSELDDPKRDMGPGTARRMNFWRNNPTIFHQVRERYKQIFRFTYYKTSINIFGGAAAKSSSAQDTNAKIGDSRSVFESKGKDPERPLRTTTDGLWMDYEFLLHRVVNLVVVLDISGIAKWSLEILGALERELRCFGSCRRVAILFKHPDERMERQTAKYLSYGLRSFARRHDMHIEVAQEAFGPFARL